MSTEKRQVLPPGLWVVATPIGNLADLSPRARAAMEQAQGLLCEDTRRTAALIAALGLERRLPELARLDAHSGERALASVLARLEAGESLALVSDAGTPAISDPGAELVARARAAGIAVTPIPGPSAPVALLSVAGFTETEFAFLGFFPRKDGERAKLLDVLEKSAFCRVFCWFESPQRIAAALAAVAARLPGARLVAGKELTKLHERFFTGSAAEVAKDVAAELGREGFVGEWCFALQLERNTAGAGEHADSSEWVKALRCLIDARVSASEAARQVHQHFGAPRKDVYAKALVLAGKKSGEGD